MSVSQDGAAGEKEKLQFSNSLKWSGLSLQLDICKCLQKVLMKSSVQVYFAKEKKDVFSANNRPSYTLIFKQQQNKTFQVLGHKSDFL